MPTGKDMDWKTVGLISISEMLTFEVVYASKDNL
jgi:hypothetical protein